MVNNDFQAKGFEISLRPTAVAVLCVAAVQSDEFQEIVLVWQKIVGAWLLIAAGSDELAVHLFAVQRAEVCAVVLAQKRGHKDLHAKEFEMSVKLVVVLAAVAAAAAAVVVDVAVVALWIVAVQTDA